LQGFLTLRTPSGIVLHECTYHRQGDKRWIGLPGRPQLDQDGRHRVDPATGKKALTALVEITGKEARERFMSGALAAIDRMLGGAP
jgi:hypothetical protein